VSECEVIKRKAEVLMGFIMLMGNISIKVNRFYWRNKA